MRILALRYKSGSYQKFGSGPPLFGPRSNVQRKALKKLAKSPEAMGFVIALIATHFVSSVITSPGVLPFVSMGIPQNLGIGTIYFAVSVILTAALYLARAGKMFFKIKFDTRVLSGALGGVSADSLFWVVGTKRFEPTPADLSGGGPMIIALVYLVAVILKLQNVDMNQKASLGSKRSADLLMSIFYWGLLIAFIWVY